MIQQVEVIQGPASARFGSQAVGGVINVVLSPLHAGDAFSRLRLDGHGRLQASGSAVWGKEGALWQAGLMAFTFSVADDNGDGFTDAPNMDRVVTTIRHQRRSDRRQTRLTARLFGEERLVVTLHFRRSIAAPRTFTGSALICCVQNGRGAVRLGRTGLDVPRRWGISPTGIHLRNHGLQCPGVDGERGRLPLGMELAEGQHLRGGASLLWDVYEDENPRVVGHERVGSGLVRRIRRRSGRLVLDSRASFGTPQ